MAQAPNEDKYVVMLGKLYVKIALRQMIDLLESLEWIRNVSEATIASAGF